MRALQPSKSSRGFAELMEFAAFIEKLAGSRSQVAGAVSRFGVVAEDDEGDVPCGLEDVLKHLQARTLPELHIKNHHIRLCRQDPRYR